MIALMWKIRNDEWSTFMENQEKETRLLTNPGTWIHIHEKCDFTDLSH